MTSTTAVNLGESVGEVMGIATSVIDTIIGNPILIMFLAVSIIGIGVTIFKKLKG